MNLTKLKYQLQVLINPCLWLRLGFTNKTFDKWLWNKMEEGVHKIEPHYHGDSPAKHSVDYAGKQIWVSNSPYYDASLYMEGVCDNPLSSRATALRFRRMYKEYLKNKIEKELSGETN